MSKVVKVTEEMKELAHVVETDDGKFYVVSTVHLPLDTHAETMVFSWDKEDDCVANWDDKLCCRYKSYAEAVNYHDDICTHLEGYLDGSYPPEED